MLSDPVRSSMLLFAVLSPHGLSCVQAEEWSSPETSSGPADAAITALFLSLGFYSEHLSSAREDPPAGAQPQSAVSQTISSHRSERYFNAITLFIK